MSFGLMLLAAVALSLAGVKAQGGVGLDPEIFQPGFCAAAAPPNAAEWSDPTLNTNLMDCTRLMEFLYITRARTRDELTLLRFGPIADVSNGTEVSTLQAEGVSWVEVMHNVSHGASLLSAHVHISAAIASQRTECFSEHVRLLLVVNLRRMKNLFTRQVLQLWRVLEGSVGEFLKIAKAWLKEAAELFDADLRTLQAVLRSWHPPTPEEARFYSHEADGRFSTLEVLRRDTFEEWKRDIGLLQGLIRHVLPVDSVVADFGSGSGHYAKWFNDTGLVKAIAFDGSPDIEVVTKGSVLNVNLAKPLMLWRDFDWVICLEVAEHIPAELTEVFLKNLDSHVRDGLVLSWAQPDYPGMGHANPQTEAQVLKLISQHTTLHLDQVLTNRIRSSATIPYIVNTVRVFTRKVPSHSLPLTGQPTCAAGDPTCKAESVGDNMGSSGACVSEDGWIYAGNDVQMFSDVTDASGCCDLCNGHDSCRYWTWSKEESHKNLCWIKTTKEYRVFHQGFVSGIRKA